LSRWKRSQRKRMVDRAGILDSQLVGHSPVMARAVSCVNIKNQTLYVQKEFSPSATNSFFTANTRCERRKAFISDSGADRFFTGRINSFNCIKPHSSERRHSCRLFARNDSPHQADKNVRAPKKNRDRGAGFSFFLFYTLAILTPAPQSGCARPSLRPDFSALAVQLTDLGEGRNGTQCCCPRTPGRGRGGPPPGRRSRGCTNCRPEPRGPGLM
jgi:hypothetical protein